MSEFLLNPRFLWDCLWQSTLILTLGFLGSGLWSHRAARAHRILVLSIVAALLTPLLTQVARQQGWGVLPPAPVSVTANSESTPDLPEAVESAAYRSTSGTDSPTPPTLRIVTSLSSPLLSPDPPSVPPKPDTDWIWPPWNMSAMALWGIVSGLILIRLSVCLIRETRLLRNAVTGKNSDVDRAIKQAVYTLQLEAFPQVYYSKKLHCPVIWCWGRRPTLYLPFSLMNSGSTEGLAGVICHELAHWKRKDHWAEGLAVLAQCLMPWQPLLWWMRHRLSALSELACDEWVLACGHSGETYSEYLYQLLSQRKTALAMPAIGSRNNLRLRIERILQECIPRPQAGWVWSGAALVGMALLAGGAAVFHASPALSKINVPPPKAIQTISTARQIHIPDGFEMLRLSPDGKHVACFSDTEELLVLDLDTGEFDKIQAPNAPHWHVLWSPDGKRLVYVTVKSVPKTDGSGHSLQYTLVATDIATRQTEALLDLQDYFLQLEDWSRDGKYILATEHPLMARHENRVLALISLETHEITFLDTPDRVPKERWGDYGIHPRFSPRGDYIACRVNQSENESRYHLHIQSLDGKRYFLTDEPFDFRYPHWSPDGNCIVYVGVLGKDASLYAVKVSEGKTVGRPFIVIPNFGSNRLLTYTPGGHLAYSSQVSKLANFATYVAEINPETQTGNLSPAPVIDGTLTHAWSTDSQSLIQPGDPLRELSLTGYELLQQKVEGGPIGHASSLCGSKSGTFWVGVSYPEGLFQVDRRTGKVESLLNLGLYSWVDETVDLAPDDRTLVFSKTGSINKIDLGTLQVDEIIKGSDTQVIFRPVVSPDQTQVACIQSGNNRNAILIVSLQDGSFREFLSFPELEQKIHWVDWSPDGRCLAYITGELWIAPLDGSPPHALERPANVYFDWLSRVQFAPDGKRLSFVACQKNRSQYWVLDRFEISPDLALEEAAAESAYTLPPRLKPAAVELVRFSDSRAAGQSVPLPAGSSPYGPDNGAAYRLNPSGLRENEMLYTDRTYKLVSIPEEFQGLTLLQTPEGDKKIWDRGYEIVLNLNRPAYAFVGVESRTWESWKKMGRPSWIEEFTATNFKIHTDNPDQQGMGAYYKVFVKKADAGELVLGPNRALGNTDMYIAFFGEE